MYRARELLELNMIDAKCNKHNDEIKKLFMFSYRA